jgi:diacylglycerol kinase family enzyme
MKLLLVVNPISGGVDKESFLDEATALLDKFNTEYQVFKTTGENDDIEIKKILDAFQPDKVASVGGDGTTLFTGVALLGRGIPMGIIPFGSANGMAMELNVNPTPIYALNDMLVSEYIRDLDIIRINEDHYCLHIGDIGINAHIVDKYSKDKNRGMITYAKYFASELLAHNLIEYSIDANGKTYSGTTLDMNFCNARKFGTGVPLTKNGSPFDGIFEIVLINDVSTAKLLRAGLSIVDESFGDDTSNEIIECEEATIHLKEKQLLQLDGEVIGEVDTIHAKILKGAIKFISHKGENKNSYFSNTKN